MTHVQQRIHNKRLFWRDSSVLNPSSVASHLEFGLKKRKKSNKYAFGQQQIEYLGWLKEL